MPPKKGTEKKKAEPKATKATRATKKDEATEEEVATEDPIATEPPAVENANAKDKAPVQPDAEEKLATNDKPSKKRKKAAESDEPQKAARRSGRGAPKSRPSQQQLLNYMLSKAAEELCRPEDESAAIKEHGGDLRTYSSSVLNPFEELLCAVILSRPISHRLGLRSIRTILNEPYNYNSAKKVRKAGQEKHHQAMWDARTQHKAKTAEEIGHVADVVLDKFTTADDKEGEQLRKVLKDCGGGVAKEREYLKSSIKGVGKTGLDIFFRRVQWIWTDAYPFVDERTMQALHKLGLPEEGEALQKIIEGCWGDLETERLAGDDEDTKKRRAFVTVLERATGADLEGKGDALLEAAAAAST